MQQKLKTILPWALVVLVLIILGIRECGRKPLDSSINIESTIETETKVEESLIDSFSVEKLKIKSQADSSLNSIDTLSVWGIKDKLHENILWYENEINSTSSIPCK